MLLRLWLREAAPCTHASGGSQPVVSRPACAVVVQGFGGEKKSAEKAAENPWLNTATTPQEEGFWNSLKVTAAELEAKPRMPIILANGTSVMLWRVGGSVFCTSATGTALAFPLVDAVLFLTPEGRHGVRSPLDGTEYDLETGAVLTWCPPEDTVLSIRNFLTRAKRAETPVPLPVYRTRTGADGTIEALITTAA